eukprot:Rhum_TRINITY_DN5757_c0_g2::Rhum_TRINITY_DN5757_c0_g2_i1::g.18275::m.18275
MADTAKAQQAQEIAAEKKRTEALYTKFAEERKVLEERFERVMTATEDKIPQAQERCVREKDAVGECYVQRARDAQRLHECSDEVRSYAACVAGVHAQWREMAHEIAKIPQPDGERQ